MSRRLSPLNLGFKLTASAGSDTPYSGTVDEERVYAFVGEQQFTADTWFEAMGNGRTFVSNGPMIEFSVESNRTAFVFRLRGWRNTSKADLVSSQEYLKSCMWLVPIPCPCPCPRLPNLPLPLPSISLFYPFVASRLRINASRSEDCLWTSRRGAPKVPGKAKAKASWKARAGARARRRR